MSLPNLQKMFNEFVWPGLGLFGESYILFSIGTIHPIWEVLYPQCFNGETCSEFLLGSLTYSVVTGIIIGMLSMGLLAGRIGRRNGSILTASLMTVGSIGLTLGSFCFRDNPHAMLKNLNCFFFVYGIGVGGEYPLSASSASERAMSEMKDRLAKEKEEMEQLRTGFNGNNEIEEEDVDDDNDHGIFDNKLDERNDFDSVCDKRGKRVVLVFSMQGMGIFVNTLTLTSLLLVTCQFGNSYYEEEREHDDGYVSEMEVSGSYDTGVLLSIWQFVYFIGTCILVYVLVSRWRHLEESTIWIEDKQRRKDLKSNSGNDNLHFEDEDQDSENEIFENDESEISKTRLILWYYGHRLFGTSFSWMLWDVAFYGNKLFQSSFLYALTGRNTTLLEISCGKLS